ncbi:MAG: DUF4139 domain-containing protein [Treponema sp.]|jgi:hypothetical protein|nr:DUF4139 domain-containing protein [Treponema sp.]
MQRLFHALFVIMCAEGLAAQAVIDSGQTAASSPRTAQPPLVSSAGETELAITRIALFSSGVGFFERSGTVSGAAAIAVPFNAGVIDDALKSLAVNDPASASLQVNYPSESTLVRTLRSLSVDLTDNPGLAEILGSLRGAVIDVYAPNLIAGRIMGVEHRFITTAGQGGNEPYLSMFTATGVKTIALKDVSGFSFKDETINADINRALDLIMASRATDTRILTVQLSGDAAQHETQPARQVSLSYVIPAPVWKVSYRLDLSQDKLQGWAIIDNDSDMDWEQVELSLVTGRPVSFIQRLYAPYHLVRPVLPLAIAGVAEAAAYTSGWTTEAPAAVPAPRTANKQLANREEGADMRESAADAAYAVTAASPSSAAGGSAIGSAVQTASAHVAGDLFEFTIKTPVTLARQQSAMLPLVEAHIAAKKTLVFSGEKAMLRGTINPAVSAELTNTTGMKLPAGPITVYDGGVYAGDALITFFPENEKRLISYADDLSVTGSVTSAFSRRVVSVQISRGVMIINRKQTYEKTYVIKNASGEEKRLIIEHPITKGAALADGAQFDERTDAVYRFTRNVPANGVISFTVQEEAPIAERITLTQLRLESFVSYTADAAIPENVRVALQKAVDLKKKADAAQASLSDCEKEFTRLTDEQSRIRQNLTAAGNQTPQGQEYLKKLSDLDTDIDRQNAGIQEARTAAQRAQHEYDAYIAELSL